MKKNRIYTEDDILGVLYLLRKVEEKKPFFFESGRSTAQELSDYTHGNDKKNTISRKTFERFGYV